jgi:hypothetical protein
MYIWNDIISRDKHSKIFEVDINQYNPNDPDFPNRHFVGFKNGIVKMTEEEIVERIKNGETFYTLDKSAKVLIYDEKHIISKKDKKLDNNINRLPLMD